MRLKNCPEKYNHTNTPDASLIVHKSRAEDVKHLVQNLVAKNRVEARRNAV